MTKTLEELATGHYAGPVKLSGDDIVATTKTLDGVVVIQGWDCEDSESSANAAYAYLAWRSHEALVAALIEARHGLVAFTGGAYGACSETIARIDAALSLAAGKETV